MGWKDLFRRFAGGDVTVDYASWDDDRLRAVWRERNQLTAAARAQLEEELARRGIDPSRRAATSAPSAQDEPPAAAGDDGAADDDDPGLRAHRAALEEDWDTVRAVVGAIDDRDLEEVVEAQVIEGSLGRAAQVAALACDADPDRGVAWLLRGAVASMRSGEADDADRGAHDEEAMAHYGRAIEAGRPEPRAWANLAAMQAERGALDDALGTIERGLAVLPDDEVMRTTHVLVLRNQGDQAAARAALERHRGGLPEATVSQLERLVETPPDAEEARPRRRWPHLAARASMAAQEFAKDAAGGAGAGALDAAERVFRRALALDPLHPTQFEAALDIGAAILAAGQPERAIALYDTILATFPDAAPLRHNRGNALFALERLDDAVAEYRRCIEAVPQWGDPRVNLVSALTRLGRFEEATAELDVLEQGGVDTDLVMALDEQLERAMEAAGVEVDDRAER